MILTGAEPFQKCAGDLIPLSVFRGGPGARPLVERLILEPANVIRHALHQPARVAPAAILLDDMHQFVNHRATIVWMSPKPFGAADDATAGRKRNLIRLPYRDRKLTRSGVALAGQCLDDDRIPLLDDRPQ